LRTLLNHANNAIDQNQKVCYNKRWGSFLISKGDYERLFNNSGFGGICY
jgi:hypothetical protein